MGSKAASLPLKAKIFLNTLDAFDAHVLCNLHCIGAPWSDHFFSGSNKNAIHMLTRFSEKEAIPNNHSSFMVAWVGQLAICLKSNKFTVLGTWKKWIMK